MSTLTSNLAASIRMLDVNASLTPLVDMVLARYGVGHDGRCACDVCEHRRGLALVDNLRTRYRMTWEELAAARAIFTDEQRSLAWSPMPPHKSTGPHDCRADAGINFETSRSHWARARHRMRREMEGK